MSKRRPPSSVSAALPLSSIRGGAWVAIDTNILVYANQRRSFECIGFLERCGSGEIQGVVPVPMVAELVHALMLIEARENNWIERADPARSLGERPDLVRRLSRYEIQMREFFGIGLRDPERGGPAHQRRPAARRRPTAQLRSRGQRGQGHRPSSRL